MDSEFEENISVIEYIKENFVGLCLLVFAGVIVYVVDHVNRINALFFPSPSPVPGISSATASIVGKKRHKKSK